MESLRKNELPPYWQKEGDGPMKSAAILVLLICFFAPAGAQTRTEERVDTGRFGAEEPEVQEDTVPEESDVFKHWLYLGLRVGPSFRVYTPAKDTPYTGGDTFAPSLDVAFQANLSFLSFLSVQAELVVTWDNASCWAYYRQGNETERYTRDYTTVSLQVPFTVQADLYPGKVRLSPFAGVYLLVPLGNLRAQDSLNSGSWSDTYSFSPPLGFLGGLSVAWKLGPGVLSGDLRYAADLGVPVPDTTEILSYRRNMLSFTLGYGWALIAKKEKAHE
jgi:hypothetical protein